MGRSRYKISNMPSWKDRRRFNHRYNWRWYEARGIPLFVILQRQLEASLFRTRQREQERFFLRILLAASIPLLGIGLAALVAAWSRLQ